MILRVDNVRKTLGGRRVIDQVSLDCDAGEIAILRGHNGAGKSTLLAIIAGLMEPDRGGIEIRGVSMSTRPVEARRYLGYVPEKANPPGHMTGDELFGLVCRLKGADPLPHSIRDALAIDAIANGRIERLSLGERRRVCLATALIGDPILLVLDEPTNGLDTQGVDTLASLLQARRDAGSAVLIATHDHAFADDIGDVRFELESGRLVALASLL